MVMVGRGLRVVFLALLKDTIIQAHSSLFWACQGGWGGGSQGH